MYSLVGALVLSFLLPASCQTSSSTLLPNTTISANNASTATTTTSNPTASISAAPFDPDINLIANRRLDFIVSAEIDVDQIHAWLSTLGPDGKWPDTEINYATGCNAQRANWPAEDHWTRLDTLSAAWHGGLPNASAALVKNQALRDNITLGVDWWFARDFQVPACLGQGGMSQCPCGTPGLWNPNWFSNVIAIPRLVGHVCLLLNETLTPTQFGNCSKILGRTYSTLPNPIPIPGPMTGANLLDVSSIGLSLGALTSNATLVSDAYTRVHGEVTAKVGLHPDGILTDGSFGQHMGVLYNGNYGKDYSNDVLELEIEAGGTRFSAPNSSKTAFEALMNGSQWMIFQNTVTGVLHWDFSTVGRMISFPVADEQATGSININLTEINELGELWGSSTLTSVFNGLTTDTGTANVGNLVGHRMFWNSDYMVVRGSNYVSTTKMFSNRTRNTECVNSQNPLGFHLSDGTSYTYLTGDEYEDIAAAWDWNLIPGITTDYAATPLNCTTAGQTDAETFVGGVTTGNASAAVMRYTNPITGALRFQKAWFYFANDVHHVTVNVLSVNDSAPVYSVLDQRKYAGNFLVNGQPPAQGGSGNFSGAQTLWHGGVGYAFPAGSPPLSVSTGERTGNWSALGISTQPPASVDLFAAWLAHGTGANATAHPVSYTVYPGRAASAFLSEAQADMNKTRLVVLANSTAVTAVQDTQSGVTMAVFWAAAGGSVQVPGTPAMTVSVNHATVMLLDTQAKKVTLADPTQTLTQITVTFAAAAKAKGHTPRKHGQGSGSTTKVVQVALPTGGFAGSSVTASFA